MYFEVIKECCFNRGV